MSGESQAGGLHVRPLPDIVALDAFLERVVRLLRIVEFLDEAVGRSDQNIDKVPSPLRASSSAVMRYLGNIVAPSMVRKPSDIFGRRLGILASSPVRSFATARTDRKGSGISRTSFRHNRNQIMDGPSFLASAFANPRRLEVRRAHMVLPLTYFRHIDHRPVGKCSPTFPRRRDEQAATLVAHVNDGISVIQRVTSSRP